MIQMELVNEKPNSWSVKVDGRFTNLIRQALQNDGIPQNSVCKVVDNAASILSNCVNPDLPSNQSSTGIVIGKVQSGKTSNFIALTSLAFDNGFDLVLVMGGTKNNLVEQNTLRLESSYSQVQNEVVVLNTTKYKDEVNEEKICGFLESGKKVIIVLLKHTKSHINFVKNNVFSSMSVLLDFPVLIIDDEGDEASLNTLINKGKESATYKSIKNLRKCLHRHSYISVTATPQANILIDAIDVLSPDFGILIDPGEGYCGLDVFHGVDDTHLVQIPDNEDSLLDGFCPESIELALAMFFVACAIRDARSSTNGAKVTSMLIHPSRERYDHRIVTNSINKVLSLWRSRAQDINDISYGYLKTQLMTAYSRYVNSGSINLPTFDEIEGRILKALKSVGVHVINGDSVSNNTDKFYDYNIYIGGNLLSRGLTLKGLTITYIIRTAQGVSNADTVEQRARWFGYKADYIDLCRVFATDKILKQFYSIRDHETDLWETVEIANLQGRNFKDIPRIFALSRDLRMTRQSVAKTEQFVFNFWNFQRAFQDQTDRIQSNDDVLSEFKQIHISELKMYEISDRSQPHSYLEDISFEEVNKFIFQKFEFPSSSKLNRGVVDKLSQVLINNGVDPKIDVYWMRDGGKPAVHPVIDGEVSEYMVGRRPQDKNKPIIYNGDRYITRPNRLQLQIHRIEKKGTNIVSPTLALFIPQEYMSRITDLVIRE